MDSITQNRAAVEDFFTDFFSHSLKLHPQIILLLKFPYIHIRTPIKNETIIDVIPTGLFNNSNIDSIISIKLYFMFALPFKGSLV